MDESLFGFGSTSVSVSCFLLHLLCSYTTPKTTTTYYYIIIIREIARGASKQAWRFVFAANISMVFSIGSCS
ncbi:hypothetical protein F4678DRAFT_419015 [Xylaria arbuscula]|nr:hypothetical protein F4678DRAFT_419015 [Xylaria arbuscula]